MLSYLKCQNSYLFNYLHMDNYRINDKSLIELTEIIKKFKLKITFLNLSNNYLTDKSIDYLLKLPIEEIHVWGNKNITSKGILKLSAKTSLKKIITNTKFDLFKFEEKAKLKIYTAYPLDPDYLNQYANQEKIIYEYKLQKKIGGMQNRF